MQKHCLTAKGLQARLPDGGMKELSSLVQDSQIPCEMRKTFTDILEDKTFPTFCKFYKGCEHGWTIRGNDSDSAADAFQQILSWLEQRVSAHTAE